MEVRAKLRHLRISPRKVRLVVDLLRGLSVEEAEQQLVFSRKSAARPLLKLLKSAVANAENNFKLEKKDLIIKKITADEGFTLKRWTPRAHGRATPLRKRSTHITLVLERRTTDAKQNKLKK